MSNEKNLPQLPEHLMPFFLVGHQRVYDEPNLFGNNIKND